MTRRLRILLLIFMLIPVWGGAAVAWLYVNDYFDDYIAFGPVEAPDSPEIEDVDAPAPTDRRARRRSGVWRRLGQGWLVGSVREYGTDKPIQGLEMTLSAGSPGPDTTVETETGADGGFVFEGVANYDDWRLTADPGEPLRAIDMAGISVTAGGQTDLGVLYATRGFSLRGRVTDLEGGGVTGAFVQVLRPAGLGGLAQMFQRVDHRRQFEAPSPLDEAESGDDGEFRLARIPPGTWDLVCEAPGYRNEVLRAVLVTPRKRARVRFVLTPGSRLEGRVVRARSGGGRPGGDIVEGLSVVAEGRSGRVFAITGRDGSFLFESIAPGRHTVTVAPDGELPTSVSGVPVPSKEPLEIRIEAGAWLEGRVSGKGKKPVAAARVTLSVSSGRKLAQVSAVTGNDGRYRLGGLPVGRARSLAVEAAGYAPYTSAANGVDGGPPTLGAGGNVRDVRLLQGGTVAGVVLASGTSDPVPGVRVSLLALGGNSAGNAAAVTGPDGGFTLSAAPVGASLIALSRPGWFQADGPSTRLGLLMDPTQAPITDPGSGIVIVLPSPGATVNRTLELSQGSVLSGQVVDGTRRPVAGAEVSITLGRVRGGVPPVDPLAVVAGSSPRLTDDQGRFELPAMPPGGGIRIRVLAQGFLDRTTDPVVVEAGRDRTDLEISLERGLAVRGSVLAFEGHPLPGAEVRVFRRGPAPTGISARNPDPVVTGQDGTFEVAGLLVGAYGLEISHPAYARQMIPRVEGWEGDVLEQDVMLERIAPITGRTVGPDGRALAGVEISVVASGSAASTTVPRARARSDARGSFEVRAVPAGIYRVTGRKEGFAAGELESVEAGGSQITVQLQTDFAISGIVLDPDGEGVPQVTVRAVGSDRRGGSAATDAEGRFRLGGLPRGAYTVRVLSPDWIADHLSDVPAGRAEVELRVSPALSISGTLTASGERPISSAKVRVEALGRSGLVRLGRVVGGKFEVRELAAGRYRLRFEVGQASVEVEADAGATEVAVTLPDSGGIRGRVVRVDGTPARGATITVTAQAVTPTTLRTDSEGRFHAEGLLSGSYVVTATLADGTSELSDVRHAVFVGTGSVTDEPDLVLRPLKE